MPLPSPLSICSPPTQAMHIQYEEAITALSAQRNKLTFIYLAFLFN